MNQIWHKVNFLAGFNWFEFRVVLLKQFPYYTKGLVSPNIYPWLGENSRIHDLSKGYDICRSLPPDRTWHKVKKPFQRVYVKCE